MNIIFKSIYLLQIGIKNQNGLYFLKQQVWGCGFSGKYTLSVVENYAESGACGSRQLAILYQRRKNSAHL
jgi:hypothetical protein